jgi:hypothetical protein
MKAPLVSTALVVILAASCTGSTDPSTSVSPSVQSTSPAGPAAVPQAALPVPAPSPWPIPALDEGVDHPISSDVAVGQSRLLRLSTHCGVDFRVDFDGSFWESYAGNIRDATNPAQMGTMTLVSDDVSVFRYRSQGHQEASIYFVRNDTPKAEGSCF